MKRVCLVVLALALSAFTGCAQPPVETPTPHPAEKVKPSEEATTPTADRITTSGHVARDETWSGTVLITGDTVVEPGVTLTILPGTKVLFVPGSDEKHTGVEVIEYYQGELDPASTLEYGQSHISIGVHPGGKMVARGTPDNPITFSSDSSNPNYADWEQIYLRSGSIFEYCVVEYGRGGVIADGDVIVSHSTFRNIFWVAIVTWGRQQ